MTAKQQRKRPDREAIRDLFRQHWETKNPAIREQLVLAHMSLSSYLARKFSNRGEPLEDLIQVAQIGLLKAIDRYDPTRGVQFTTYATVTIVGEIKRHFRDKYWSVRVPRRLRELNNALMKTAETMAQRLGRSPTMAEIAEETGVPFEEVVEAFELGRAYNPASLDAEVGEGGDAEHASTLLDSLGEEDPALRHLEDRHTIQGALAALPERHREILRLRYYDGLSQAEIARRLSISQMHVSRIQRDAIVKLREIIEA